MLFSFVVSCESKTNGETRDEFFQFIFITESALPPETTMFSLPLSSFSNASSFVSSSSLLKSSSHRGRTNRSPTRDGGITRTKAADVTREEGNDALVRQQRRQRGREAKREEERATTNNKTRRSRREVLKILPTSGVALVVVTAIGGFTTAHPSFAGAEKLSSVEEKELAKERRKAAVRAAAERAKETGVGGNAFSDSEYMVGEDHSPNAHSHQEEGSKGSFV